jgi:segregation and condensation protein B
VYLQDLFSISPKEVGVMWTNKNTMPTLKSKIESLLLVSNQPLSFKQLAKLTKSETIKVKEATKELANEYNNRKDSGIQILKDNKQIQLVTSPENAKLVADFIKDETTGELTPASLETLTIIAYRGPITKAELEQIRGVNCSIILRNLIMRGLVESIEDKKKMEIYYNITLDFMKFLGIADVRQLPDYEKLNKSETLDGILSQVEEE